MNYKETGKKVNKDTASNEVRHTLKSASTGEMLLYIAKRHKFGLSVTTNIIFAVYFFLPFLPGEIFSIITGLVK